MVSLQVTTIILFTFVSKFPKGRASTKDILPSVKTVPCPDGVHFCPDGHICCYVRSSGSYSHCCPQKCCPSGKKCAPASYRCCQGEIIGCPLSEKCCGRRQYQVCCHDRTNVCCYGSRNPFCCPQNTRCDNLNRRCVFGGGIRIPWQLMSRRVDQSIEEEASLAASIEV